MVAWLSHTVFQRNPVLQGFPGRQESEDLSWLLGKGAEAPPWAEEKRGQRWRRDGQIRARYQEG